MRLGLRVLARQSARAGALVALAAVAAIGFGCAGSVEDRLTEVRALQDAGQFNESIEPLRQLLARDPELAEANYLLGVALVQTGQPSLAVWPLEKAAASPDHAVPAGLLLASTFLSLDSFPDSIRIANKVLETKPDNVNALRIRAQAKLGDNKREEALQDTTRLRELAPDDFQAALTSLLIVHTEPLRSARAIYVCAGLVPLVLAGGLTPENVAEAIGVVRPDAVDTAGGVESSPGRKDDARMRAFCEAANRAFGAA